MCTLSSFSILFGELKRKNLVRKIALSSFIAVLVQAFYISIMNKLIFSIYTFILPYLILILLSCIPMLLIKYENYFLKAIKRAKSEI